MNVSANTSTELRDEADMIRDRQIKMHTHSREVYRSEHTKPKEQTGVFMTFSSVVGVLVILIAIIMSIFAGIGYLYNWLSPIMDKCIDWFFAHSIGVFIAVGVISIFMYALDAFVEYVKKILE